MINNTIQERLRALRALLEEAGVQAFIVPSTDPHQSEYVADHWSCRAWISGFNGSAGTVAVTLKEAGLWTDSRYFLQAAQQLEGTGIDLYKLKIAGTPSIAQMLSGVLGKGDKVAIDGDVYSASDAAALSEELSGYGLELVHIEDPFQKIWLDRPAIPADPVHVHEIRYAGVSARQKIARLREMILKKGIQAQVISALDEIAWLLNIRGTDVHCNPVAISYVVLDEDLCHVFVQKEKLTEPVRTHLMDSGCEIHSYEEVGSFLATLRGRRIGYAPSLLNASLERIIRSVGIPQPGPSLVQLLKAIKNPVEIEGFHSSMVRDGVAMCRFLMWLERTVKDGVVTEVSAGEKLRELRSEMDLFMDESFDTIAGFAHHGAIVHYEATPETDIRLEPRSFLLLDSGAQYKDGTTDITRTIPLGTLTDEEREDYTLVLKGNLDLAMAVFPEGTRGSQVDILARLPLWKRQMNYLHGTGHGVGSCLNVHEGPHSVRMEENPIPLMAGMIVTDEPGLYKEGKHGIRHENMLLVVEKGEGMLGNYLGFEVLTYCPIATWPILQDLLSREEIDFLNDYHRQTYEKLSPLMNAEEQAWLREATKPI